MDPIIIVGSGLAGYSVARNLRKLDRFVPITIVTADSGEFYSKPLLSEAFATGKTAATLAAHTAAQMGAKIGVEIRTQTTVTQIHSASREIEVMGERRRYAKLVLALGADPIVLPIAGDAAQDMLSVNDLRDYARFRAALANKNKVAILGAGLIGCEFANDLATAGYRVDVVDIAAYPMHRLLPPAGGALLMQALAGIGVAWHLGTSAQRIERGGDGYRLRLANGETIDTAVVLSAVGLRPRTGIAQAAGLTVRRGIVVDRYLCSSDPHIYALGDCAEVDGLVLPYTAPIMYAAKALASTLHGQPCTLRYPAMPVTVKTPACPTVVAPPLAGSAGRWQVSSNGDGIKALYLDDAGRLHGFALNGAATAESLQLSAALPMWLE